MPNLLNIDNSLLAIKSQSTTNECFQQVCKTSEKQLIQGKYFISVRCLVSDEEKIITIEKIKESCIECEALRERIKIIIWKFSKDGKRAAVFISVEGDDSIVVRLGLREVDDIEYDVQLSKSYIKATQIPRCSSPSPSSMSTLTYGTAKRLPRQYKNNYVGRNKRSNTRNSSNNPYLVPPPHNFITSGCGNNMLPFVPNGGVPNLFGFMPPFPPAMYCLPLPWFNMCPLGDEYLVPPAPTYDFYMSGM